MTLVEPIEGLRAEWDGGRWRLVDDPGPEAVEVVRMLSVKLDDGRSLGVVAARPRGASGHGEESVRALVEGADDGTPDFEEVLLSTEYDGDGLVLRAGAELYPRGGYAMRLAGDRAAPPDGTARSQTCPMSFRLDGVAGTGVYELQDRRPAS